MQYDIIIIGGGMVGASLACALQDTSLRVALIDATPHAPSNDPRLIALSYSSCNLLKKIGIWPALSLHAEPIQQIHVSHRGHFGITRIKASDIELPTLGHLIPAHIINTALDEKLKNISHVEVIRPATLKEITNITADSENFSSLSIQTATETIQLTARLVIGADGTHSTVRNLLNIPTETIDYQQSALVTITELQRSHHNIAYERFLEQGAIAMLPLTGLRAATICTNSNEQITHLMQMSNEDFLVYLQNQFGYRLGRLTGVHKRYTYPLKLVLAKETQKQNVILIGNAAHTFHPIAAQGFNLALHEVAELVEQLKTMQQPFMFTPSNMKEISTQLSHRLTWLFSTDFFLLNVARQFGMFGLDFCTPAKKYFMRKSLGRTGKIPSLLL